MPEIFVQLRKTSARCLEICLRGTNGGLENAPKTNKVLESSMQIIKFESQIKQQLMDMKTALCKRGLSKDDINGSLNVSLNVACEPLENEMCSVRNKELALFRMQTFNALLNVLQKRDSQSLPILAMMNHTMDLCKQVIAEELSNRQLEEQLADIRRRRMELQIRQQELFKKLKSSEGTNSKRQEVEMKMQDKGRESLQSIANRVMIIQEVFQRLIMSAQVHWAEDPHLTSLLLRMRVKDPSLP
ncbi:centromere protein H-like isoform X2 [Mixophyes fleayi]